MELSRNFKVDGNKYDPEHEEYKVITVFYCISLHIAIIGKWSREGYVPVKLVKSI